MTKLLPAPHAAKLKPVIPPAPGRGRPTRFFMCDRNGVEPTTTSRQTHACRSNQTSCLMTSALHANWCSVHKSHAYPSQGASLGHQLLVIHQPTLYALWWYASGTLNRFPGMSTCGRAPSPMGGSKRRETAGSVGGRQHCPSLTAHPGAHPWSWRLRRQKIFELSAPRRR